MLLAIAAEPADSTYGDANGRIAYSSGSGTAREIMTINPNGTFPSTLTTNSLEEAEPRYNVNGTTITFRQHDGDIDVWTIPGSGGSATPITTDPGDDQNPDFSPTGGFAFESDRAPVNDEEIYSADSTGGNVTRLTARGDNGNPAYSPGGGKIAFISDRDGDDEVFMMKANGKEEKQLTKNGAEEGDPEWSSNGKLLVFESDRAGGDGEIVRMKLRNRKQRLVTNNSVNDEDPDFAPEGDLIAFESNSDGDAEIWTMALDGTGLFNVTDNTGSPTKRPTGPTTDLTRHAAGRGPAS